MVCFRDFGTLRIQLGKFNVDMSGSGKFGIMPVIRKHYGIDIYDTTVEEVAR